MAATLGDDNGGIEVLRWRISKSEDRIAKLDDWRRDVDFERASSREILKKTSDDVTALSKAFEGLRKTLITFAFTIAGSAIVFAFGIFAATGKLP